MRVSVFGLGKLGACMAAAFAARGIEVWGVDVDGGRAEAFGSGEALYPEPRLAESMREGRDRLRATTDASLAVQSTDASFVVVPTPSLESGDFSLEFCMQAVGAIGAALRSKPGRHLVVITSTVLPGACSSRLIPELEAASGRPLGPELGFCYSPEFIALGSVINDFLNPDMVLIGESDTKAGEELQEILTSVLEREAPVARMTIVNAELAKLAVNTFVTAKIAFANMLGSIAETLPGGEVDQVTGALGLDSRIGPKYLRSGAPFGGPCFPRDVRALSFLAQSLGADSSLASAVEDANDGGLARLIEAVKKLNPASVAILGLAYKPGSPVLEDSPAMALARSLAQDGVQVRAFDRMADYMTGMGHDGVSVSATLSAALSGSEVMAVMHADPLFRSGDVLSQIRASGIRAVIDPWRLFQPGDLKGSVELVAFGRWSSRQERRYISR
ncbi:MAG TPA: nucleotide sugar dehydrogenase [Dehalococcoidia bacterium]